MQQRDGKKYAYMKTTVQSLNANSYIKIVQLKINRITAIFHEYKL